MCWEVNPLVLEGRMRNGRDKNSWETERYDDTLHEEQRREKWEDWRGGLVVGRRTCDLVVAGSRPGRDAAA